MKIVDRKEFLSLPSETIYAEFTPDDFIGVLNIKYQSYTNDWIYMELNDFDDWNDSNERYEGIDNMIKNNAEFPLKLDCSGRDGMYEENQLFVIYDNKDVEKIIDVLKSTLKE